MADVSKYIDRAEQEARRKNFGEAIALYRQILEIDPDCGDARRGIRRAALEKTKKRYPSGLERGVATLLPRLMLPFAQMFKSHGSVANLCETALAKDPRNVKLNHKLGHALLAQGHENSAMAAFAVVTEFDEKDSESLKILGGLHAKRKELEQALDCFERALKVNPRDQEAARMRKNLAAEGAIQRGGYSDAKSARDLAKDEREVQSSEAKRRIVRTSADLDAAIAECEAALEEDGSDVKTRVRLGDFHLQAGNVEGAIDQFSAAAKLDPSSNEIADKLGDARIRRLEARIQALETEARAGEDGAEDRLRRLRAEAADFRLEEFRRRVQTYPTDAGLRFRLGRLLLDADEQDEAIQNLQQAVNDPKHRISARHMLGRAFSKKGLTDLAVKQLQEAADQIGGLTDQKKEILYELGLVHERAGNSSEALAIFKSIYESDINYKDIGQRISALS